MITTLEEQQHLVLKVIQPPKRSGQIAAIPLRDYKRMEAKEFALIKTKNSSKMVSVSIHRCQKETSVEMENQNLL